MTQEHARKDIERVFGGGVLERKLRGWYIDGIKSMIDCCIVIHNMKIEAWCEDCSSSDLMNVPTEELEEEGDQDSLFLEEAN